jgi:hypothetical protein
MAPGRSASSRYVTLFGRAGAIAGVPPLLYHNRRLISAVLSEK